MRPEHSDDEEAASSREGEAARPERRFQRRIEAFSCVSCGLEVRGDGYTNHCPACLTSLHVDVRPGDRAANCGWPMAAVAVARDGKKGLRILHRCEGCGHEKWNRAADDDDPDELGRLTAAR